MNVLIKVCLAVSCFYLSILPSYAGLIPVEVVINGSVELDLDPSSGSDANFDSQTGTLDQRLNGVGAITNINGLSADAANPRLGQLIEMGDGFGASYDVSTVAGGDSGDFIFDFAFQLANTSLTDSFLVSFAVNYSNTVDADGTDSFIDSELSLLDTSLAEFFASDLTSDTFFGDEVNGVGQATSGALISRNGIFNFDVMLAANAIDSFSGVLKVDGGNFGVDSSIRSQASAFISVVGVRNITEPPNEVPEPSSLLLFLLAVFGLFSQSNKSFT